MSQAPASAQVLTFEDARHCVEQHAATLRPPAREQVSLLDGAGRILAEPISADRDIPPFPRATRDGYAVQAADLAHLPANLQIIGEVKAGDVATSIRLQSGQAVSIMTGAAVPPGADSVVMVEYTTRAGDRVDITQAVRAGDNVVPTGAEARRGDQLLSPGILIDYAAIAGASSVGRSKVQVYARPKIAVLSTGDEVVNIDAEPGPAQIRNSNTFSLSAQISAAGGDPLILPIAPDEPVRLRELILQGLNADLLVLAGGVSMGKYDLVEQVLSELHAEFFFTGAQIQPGRPVVFGSVPALPGSSQRKYFFGLPGNPVSTMVTFELFVRPMLEALAGKSPTRLVFTHARLKSEIKVKTGLKRFLPAVLSGEFEQSEVELARWQGSGDFASMARSNCYIVVPADRERIEAGEWIPVLRR